MRLLLVVAVSGAMLAGCVSSSTTHLADGSKGHVISCPSPGGLVGALTDWGTCFQKAGELCQTLGYTVMHKSGEAGFTAAVNQYGGGASSTASRALIIRCNDGTAAPITSALRP